MKHIILGTAGHVDHGKTSLIKALTDIDCDTHKEEKERGITINLGFSHLDLPSGNSLGIIDVPGHKDFINTMISGVGSIDIALLVIAADSGIMPQTLEHLNIIRTLGIDKIIVALNKSDLVDADILELASDEIKELFVQQNLNQPSIISVSAVSKEGIKDLISEIEKQSLTVKPKTVGPVFRMFVDRLFTIKGLGSIVTGSVLSGQAKLGEQIYLLPNVKDKYKIKSIQRHGNSVDVAFAGDRAAMNLSGIKKENLQKGSVLTNKVLESTNLIDANLTVFDEKTELKIWSTVIFYSGTFESLAKVHLLNKDAIKKGEDAIVQIHLEKSAVLLNKDKFIIRKSSADRTIGGGLIIDVLPLHHKKRTERLIHQLERINQQILLGNKLIEQIEFELGKDHLPIYLKDLIDKINNTESDIREVVESSENVHVFSISGESVLILTSDKQFYKNEINSELEAYHRKYYLLEDGISTNFFSGKFNFSKNQLGKKFIEFLLLEMLSEGTLKKVGSTWSKTSHKIVLDDDLKQKIGWLEKKYFDYQLQLPVIKDIEIEARERKVSKDEFKMFLKYLMDQQRLIKFQDNYIHVDIFEKVKLVTKKELEQKIQGINLSEFRQLTTCTKKMIPILVGLLEEQKLIDIKVEGTHTIMQLKKNERQK